MASPGKPKLKKGKPDEDQAERFRAIAERLCADLTGKKFEGAFRAIAPPKRIRKRVKTKTPAD
jgi:hypothetical protein